ncbi:hypothetical protein SH139x_004409 [Planctomycetaceae bacterium SH139]
MIGFADIMQSPLLPGRWTAVGPFLPITRQLPRQCAVASLLTVCLLTSSGCLNPNIPSVRQGALPFGVEGLPAQHPQAFEATIFHTGHDDSLSPRLPGGPVGLPPDDPHQVRTGALADHIYDQGPAKQPDIPWPRFHPLPTRPVL